MLRSMAVLVLLFGVCICSVPVAAQVAPTPVPLPTACGDEPYNGCWWLSLDQGGKEAYVAGFLDGSRPGSNPYTRDSMTYVVMVDQAEQNLNTRYLPVSMIMNCASDSANFKACVEKWTRRFPPQCWTLQYIC